MCLLFNLSQGSLEMKHPFLYLGLGFLFLIGGGFLIVWKLTTSNGSSAGTDPGPSFQDEQDAPEASLIASALGRAGGEPAFWQVGWTAESLIQTRPFVDLTSRPLDKIPVGTMIGTDPPKGWSHLVTIAVPTLVAEDERLAGKIASNYAQMFKFAVLANVVPGKRQGKGFRLGRVARGFAVTVENEQKIINSGNTQGTTLGPIDRLILSEEEKHLDADVRQVARTPTMMIFDAQAVMRRNDDHVKMIMRHAVLVDPGTGRLYTLVWLLTRDFETAEEVIQLLHNGMWEKRWLSVKRDKFLGPVPASKEAFALRQVPQGTPIPYTPALKEVATVKEFTETSVPRIEDVLRTAALKAAEKRAK